MKYIWYGFLGLFSLGCLCVLGGAILLAGIIHHYGSDLPDYKQLKDYQPSIVSRLYAGDGRLMAEYASEKRIFMPIETIPDRVKNAFIAAEDQNFYTHPGIDLFAIARAMAFNVKNIGSGRRPIGASTIPQQVAKNFLLTNEVSYERKIKEAILAYRMNKVMSKDRMLELYLNEIYLGSRSYGVAAAALQYFNKSLDDLTIAEAAYLAALPKAPNNYHPVRNHDAAMTRRNWVIGRMYEDGYIAEGQAELAQISPLEIRSRNDGGYVSAPYFAEEVRRELVDYYGEESLYQGGLAVRSTIDPTLQEIAVKSLRDGLQAYDHRHGYRGPIKTLTSLDNWQSQLGDITPPRDMPDNWDIAIVLESNKAAARIGLKNGKEGLVLLKDLKWARKYVNEGYARGPVIKSAADVVKTGDLILVEALDSSQGDNSSDLTDMADNAHYALRQIPIIEGALVALDPRTGRILAMQGGWKYTAGSSEFNRATQAKRQPGSAFKPFVYLAALDKGFTPATLVLDAPFVIEDRPGNYWSPSNYSGEYYGPTPIRIGIEKSKNLMTVRLADFVGMDTISKYADAFGIAKNMPPLLANSLGSAEATPLQMTAAYAMLANGGKRITPSLIDRIQDRYGKTVYRHDDRSCALCGPNFKWEDQPTPDLPDTRTQITDPRTTYQMVSMLEGVVQRGTGIRIKSLGRPLAGKTGTTNKSKDTWFIGFSPDLVVGVFVGFDNPRSLGKRETGSSAAVPIFKEFMASALKDRPITPFRIPPGIRQVRINAENGTRAKFGDDRVIWEAFVTGTEPNDEVYILGGDGLSKMSETAFREQEALDNLESTDPNDPNGINAQNLNGVYTINEPIIEQNQGISGGTGGIY